MLKDTKICCEQFAKEIGAHKAFVGGGLYPAEMQPRTQIEYADGSWNVNGCCGGGCFVLDEIKFCPFCGSGLPDGN